MKASLQEADGQTEEQSEEVERLELENNRLNEFVTLHMEDAAELRDKVVVLRDCLSDQKDENRGELVCLVRTLQLLSGASEAVRFV